MNITKLPSGSYRIRETVNGIQYSKTVKFKPKKYEAEQIIAEMVEAGEANGSRITVKEAMEKYIERKEKALSPSTLKNYKLYINKFPKELLNTRLADLNDDVAQRYINKMADAKTQKYIKNLVSFLTASIKMFRKKYIMDIQIPEGQPSKRKVHQPIDKEIESLLSSIKGSQYEIPIKLALLGLRRSEICALTIDDIGDSCVTVNKTFLEDKDGKWVIRHKLKNGDPERVVYIPKELEEEIRKQGYVYRGHPNSIYKNLSKTLQELHIDHFSLHRLRHYYASVSHALGVPDEYIMQNGGWKTDHVLKNVYRHTQADRVEELGKPVKEHYDTLFS